MNERRKEHRLKANLPIKIIYDDGEILGRTENISRLGTYFETNREIPAGKHVEIILELPAYTKDLSLSGPVRCKGSVFRCTGYESAAKKFYGIGIFFINFAEKTDREKLSLYIDFLIGSEEQEISAGLRRRRERGDIGRLTKESEEFYLKEGEFQKQVLGLLKEIKALMKQVQRFLQENKKKK
jgi:hypothetical protein